MTTATSSPVRAATEAPDALHRPRTAPAGAEAAPTGPAEPGPLIGSTAAASRRAHLHDVDLVRLLTFVAVVGVHTTGGTNPFQSVGGNAALMLLHFTREAFFFLTTFVLFHTHYDRPLALGRFWRRRFLLVGVPYVVWTVAYASPVLVRQLADGQISASARTLGYDLITGDAWYHMYFLLVTLQVYLLYPLLARLVRRTAGYHWQLLAGSALLQIATLAEVRYGRPWPGVAGILEQHCHELFAMYQFWLVAGALAAVHGDRFRDWMSRHIVLTMLSAALAAGAAELCYTIARHHGQAPFDAASVFQPIMVPWGVTSIMALFALGAIWEHKRRPGRLDSLMRRGSELSFGIYLVHPAILPGVLALLPRTLPPPWSTLSAMSATLFLSAAVVALCRPTPLSLAVSGRPRRRPRRTGAKTGPKRPSVPAPTASTRPRSLAPAIRSSDQ
ncbi:acyltransferase [Frankia sp. Cj3]|uniref:acyltransferase n=1 Tax=Frankia sp. Cj3 TaxID=2880976 RepID=UPI001EF53113|nr:acyltransferase [Frankia sp. Cj3]